MGARKSKRVTEPMSTSPLQQVAQRRTTIIEAIARAIQQPRIAMTAVITGAALSALVIVAAVIAVTAAPLTVNTGDGVHVVEAIRENNRQHEQTRAQMDALTTELLHARNERALLSSRLDQLDGSLVDLAERLASLERRIGRDD